MVKISYSCFNINNETCDTIRLWMSFEIFRLGMPK